ncbi:MAG TPA: DUF2231 domain-containing protein [Armatimonadota bacterium]|nr:DUF2231 domain-containing protein [Armatimonadota bacterium]
MLNIHPLFAHFPIALLITAFALEALGLLLNNDRVLYAAAINIVLGAVGAVAAVATGLVAEGGMSAGDAAVALAREHKLYTLLALAMAAPLAAWRVWRGDRISKPARGAYLVLMLVMLAVVAIGAHSGGRLVYEFGAGASLMGAAYE